MIEKKCFLHLCDISDRYMANTTIKIELILSLNLRVRKQDHKLQLKHIYSQLAWSS